MFNPEDFEDLRILLSCTSDERNYGDDISSFEIDNSYGNRQAFSDSLMSDNAEISLTMLTVDYDVDDEWFVTTFSTIDETKRIRERDGDYSPLPVLTNRLENRPETTSHKVRFIMTVMSFREFLAVTTTNWTLLIQKH